MRASTEVYLAALHVGIRGESPTCWHGTFSEVLMEFAKWASSRTIAQRFSLAMARTEDEALRGVQRAKASNDLGLEANFANLESLMAGEFKE